jgi:enamine deaminase RidA (YjgF/YER057c/UK114 family)
MSAEDRLRELNLALPPAPKPMGVYKPIVVCDRLAFVSGHGPLRTDRTLITGRIGADLSLEDGYAAAHQTGLAILATVRQHFGSLDPVQRVIKTLGMVNSTPDFVDHPKVINGCSELFAKIWGSDHGVGARSAVGMGSLPGNIPVEIEVIFQLA